MSSPEIAGVLFDAYGTLFDIGSLAGACRDAAPDHPDLLDRWRAKQLEYSWLRSMMDRYVDFWQITVDALADTVARLGLRLSPHVQRDLAEAWLALDAYPRVPELLDALRGRRTAILSNGSPAMLEAICSCSGLAGLLDDVISVDQARVFKPSPAAYALGTARFGVPAAGVLFVSANSWDVAGAKAFGYQVAWINRLATPLDQLGVTPDYVVDELGEIGSIVNARG